MINNRVIENELIETEKHIEDLLLRIKELRKEVSEITPNKKVLYEQHHCFTKNLEGEGRKYYFKSRLPDENVRVLNYCKPLINFYNTKLGIYKYDSEYQNYIEVDSETKHIIETYIPSQKLLLVVEL